MYVDRRRYAEITGMAYKDEDPALDRALREAERDIDSLTFGRIRAGGLDSLTALQRENVERAVCEQAEFRLEYAGYLDNPLSSYGINGVSMSWDASKVCKIGGVYTQGSTYGLLTQTGLTYLGVLM